MEIPRDVDPVVAAEQHTADMQQGVGEPSATTDLARLALGSMPSEADFVRGMRRSYQNEGQVPPEYYN